MVALVFTLTLLPALMAVFPERQKAEGAAKPLFFSQRMLVGAGGWATRHAGALITVYAAIVAVSLLGAVQLRVAHSPFDWFPEGDIVRDGMQTMNVNMGGMGSFELMIETGEVNGFHDPAFLRAVDELSDYVYALTINGLQTGKVFSLTDILKETHKALNENRPDFYVIPDDPNLVAQELLLFENAGSDDVEDLVDSQFESGRISVRMPMEDSVLYPDFIAASVERAQHLFGPDVGIEVSGIIHIMSATMTALIGTMIRSYAVALAIITPLMVLLIGNLRVGLVSMIPNLVPVLMTLGIMGWLDIPLDAFTLLVGSIAIGLAVDDTIHFLHNFRRYLEESGDPAEAVRHTLETTGQAPLFASIVLAAGFAIYTQAYLTNLFYFGLLTSMTIAFAFLADLLLAPAILMLLFRDASAAPATSTSGAPER